MKSERIFYILGLLSLVLYSALMVIPFYFKETSLPIIHRNPSLVFSAIFIGLLVAYFVGFRKIISQGSVHPLLKVIVAFSILFSIVLLIIPPIGSSDVFTYILRARVFTEYGKNPYLVTTANFSQDLFYPYSPKIWHNLPMQYGPVFAIISIATSFISQDGFWLNQFILKILLVLIHLGNILLIIRLTKLVKPELGDIPTFLYAWNPLVLFEVANNAHNDILMTFFVLLALYFYFSKKYFCVLPAILLSVLTKYVTLLLLPLFVYLIIKKIPKEKLVNFLTKTILVGILLTIILYAPFWHGIATFKSLYIQTQIYAYSNLSLGPMLIFGLREIFSIFSPVLYPLATQMVRLTALFVFFLLYILFLFRFFKIQKKDIIWSSFLVLFLYTVIAVTALQPWYFLWVIPLAALSDRRLATLTIFFVTILGLLSYSFLLIGILFLIMFLLIIFFGIYSQWSIIKIVRSFFLYEESS